tara:strand:+ start:200 stop:406 length:207 start_codon:yes stop_codon:yes gene_type:complete
MMSFKELNISMQSDMIDVAKAHQRIEERKLIAMNDADVDDDRHDSDAEGHRQESAELRDYSFLRSEHD